MKKLSALSLLLLASSSWGAIKLSTQLEVGDDFKEKSTVVVKDGEWVDLGHGGIKARLMAEEKENGTAIIKAEVYSSKDGRQELLGSPSVVSPWGQVASVGASELDGRLKYRITVTPEKD